MAVVFVRRGRRRKRISRLKLIIRGLTRKRGFYVITIFLVMLLASSVMFYYSERVVHHREDVDFPTAMYWALITMATVGYGDVVVTHDALGYAVAGATAIMGIATYTLVISTLADAFFYTTLKKALGRGKLRKKILVIGSTPSCREAIEELVLSGLGDVVGWVTAKEPKAPPSVDFVVGPYNEETLRRAGVTYAEKAILCLKDDSTTLHLVLLMKKMNKRIKMLVLVSDPSTAELLKELGVGDILTHSLLGRIAASAVFEPTVIRFVSEVVTAKGGAELSEVIVTEDGLTIDDVEKTLIRTHPGYRFEVIAVRRGEFMIYAPRHDMKLAAGDRLVILKARSMPWPPPIPPEYVREEEEEAEEVGTEEATEVTEVSEGGTEVREEVSTK